jgi:hypothetical protein
MLVTTEGNRRNRNRALTLAGVLALVSLAAGWFFPPVLLALLLCPLVYWLLRRRCLRRFRLMREPFPASWEQILQRHVAFFSGPAGLREATLSADRQGVPRRGADHRNSGRGR